MSKNPVTDPKEQAATEPQASESPKEQGKTDPLANLLNKASERASKKRAEITDQIQAAQENRDQQEKESTEKRRQELLRKREAAIKKRQTQLMSSPSAKDPNESDQKGKDVDPVPVPDFDLNVKESRAHLTWIGAVLVVGLLGGGGWYFQQSSSNSEVVPASEGEQTPGAEGTQEATTTGGDKASPTIVPGDTTETAPSNAENQEAKTDKNDIKASPAPDSTENVAKGDATPTPAAKTVDKAAAKPKKPKRKSAKSKSSKRKKTSASGEEAPAKKKGRIGLKRGLIRSNIK